MKTQFDQGNGIFINGPNPDNSPDMSQELQDQVFEQSNQYGMIFQTEIEKNTTKNPLFVRKDKSLQANSNIKRSMESPSSSQGRRQNRPRQSQELDFLKVKSTIKIFVNKKEKQFCLCIKKKLSKPQLVRSKPIKSEEIKFQRDASGKRLGRTTMKQFTVLEKLTHMSLKKRQDKAVRHLYDALYFRSPNNELDYLDKASIKLVWRFANSSTWNTFLWFVTLFYQLQTFFEPANMSSTDSILISRMALIYIEIIIISFFLLDYLLILTYTIPLELRENGWREVFKAMIGSKNIFKLIFLIAFISDLCWQYYMYPQPTLRFSRIVRAFMLCAYSKDLRRNLLGYISFLKKGILKSLKQLLILFLFYFIIIGVWAFIGSNIFQQKPNVSDMNDYTDFFKLFNMLYMLSTLDFYPDISTPYYLDSPLYLIYFIPYVLLFIFLFIPIPLAVVYEGFRQYRTEILINDRIKQKTALLTCFMCLDMNKKSILDILIQDHISEYEFIEFLKITYNYQLDDGDLYEFYDLIDNNRSGKISIDEFFTICDIIENVSKYQLDKIKPLTCWVNFRAKMNQKYNLLKILDGTAYVMTLLMITLGNSTFIITSFFADDPALADLYNIMDEIFLIIYSLEVILKIIALGFEDYFEDDWNKFDFFLVAFQIIFDYIIFDLLTKQLFTSVKAQKLVRLAKIQKIFRLFRAFRTLKLVSFVATGFQIFNDVKNLFYKILICIPAVLKLTSIVWIVFFVYATVGVEILSTNYQNESLYEQYDCDTYGLNYQWGGCNYTSFDTFSGSYYQLLQTFLSAQWAQVVFDTAKKTGNLIGVSLFLGSFVFLSIFQLALIGGLVWEVFMIGQSFIIISKVDKSVQDEDAQKVQQLENQNLNGSQQKIGESEESNFSDTSPLRKIRIKGERKQALVDLEQSKSKINPNIFNHKHKKQHKTILLLRDETDGLNFGKSKPMTRSNKMFDRIKQNSNWTNLVKISSTPVNNKYFLAHKPIHKYIHRKLLQDSVDDTPVLDDQHSDSLQSKIILNKIKVSFFEPIEDQFQPEGNEDIKEIEINYDDYHLVQHMYQNKFHNLESYRIMKNIQMDEFIQSFINQIKEDLKNFDNVEERTIQTKKNLIANAILKNANQEDIRKKEFNHFIKMFGSEFDKLREISLTSLFALESRILFDLNAILKFSNVNTKYFFQILLCLEIKIQQHLMKPGSYIKMLHQLSNGDWFQVCFDHDSFRFDFLEHGPWNFYNQVRQSKQEKLQKSGLPHTPYEQIQQNLLIADDLDFEMQQNAEKQEAYQFQNILVDISKQFLSPLSMRSFEQDQFKFAMVEIPNNNQQFLKQEFIRTYHQRGSRRNQEDQITATTEQDNLADQCTIQRTLIIALVKHTFNDSLNNDQVKSEDINSTYLPFQYVLDLLVELGLLIQNHNINFFQKVQEIVFRNSAS